MSLKKVVINVVVGGLTGVVFNGIGYGILKLFSVLKLNIFNKSDSKPEFITENRVLLDKE